MKRVLLIAALAVSGCAQSAAPRTEGVPTLAPNPTLTAGATPSPAQATPPPTPTPEPTPAVYAPGEVITVTTNGAPWADVTISKVRQVRKYDGPYNLDDVPAKGNVYLEVFVTYEALDDGVDYNPFDWQVFADGTAVDNYAFVSNGPKPALGSGSLPKGRKAEGYIVYEVPAAGRVLMSYGGRFGSPPVFEVEIRAA